MGRTQSIKHHAKNVGAKQSSVLNDKQSFVLSCPSTVGQNDLLVAIHALYYLPQNFKLVADSSIASRESTKFWADETIMDRVQFKKQTGLSTEKTSPFSSADAVIYNDEKSAEASSEPHVTLSHDTMTGIINDHHHGFRVPANNPEALATAELKLAGMLA